MRQGTGVRSIQKVSEQRRASSTVAARLDCGNRAGGTTRPQIVVATLQDQRGRASSDGSMCGGPHDPREGGGGYPLAIGGGGHNKDVEVVPSNYNSINSIKVEVERSLEYVEGQGSEDQVNSIKVEVERSSEYVGGSDKSPSDKSLKVEVERSIEYVEGIIAETDKTYAVTKCGSMSHFPGKAAP